MCLFFQGRRGVETHEIPTGLSWASAILLMASFIRVTLERLTAFLFSTSIRMPLSRGCLLSHLLLLLLKKDDAELWCTGNPGALRMLSTLLNNKMPMRQAETRWTQASQVTPYHRVASLLRHVFLLSPVKLKPHCLNSSGSLPHNSFILFLSFNRHIIDILFDYLCVGEKKVALCQTYPKLVSFLRIFLGSFAQAEISRFALNFAVSEKTSATSWAGERVCMHLWGERDINCSWLEHSLSTQIPGISDPPSGGSWCEGSQRVDSANIVKATVMVWLEYKNCLLMLLTTFRVAHLLVFQSINFLICPS